MNLIKYINEPLLDSRDKNTADILLVYNKNNF
jgi:hypothetical protein